MSALSALMAPGGPPCAAALAGGGWAALPSPPPAVLSWKLIDLLGPGGGPVGEPRRSRLWLLETLPLPLGAASCCPHPGVPPGSAFTTAIARVRSSLPPRLLPRR